MFGSKKEETQSTKMGATSMTVNLLSGGTEFEGKVKTEGDIRIDGKFTGELLCKAKIIIGPTGMFNGTIQCENAVIEGTFTGKLQVRSLLEVKENGKLSGDIVTGKLVVQAGAIFDVSCNMGAKKPEAPSNASTISPSASKKTVALDE